LPRPPRSSLFPYTTLFRSAVTQRLESQAYFADVRVESAASGEGSMNLGTWNRSTKTSQSTSTNRCTIRMIAIVLADRAPSLNKRSEEHTSELQSLRHLVCR